MSLPIIREITIFTKVNLEKIDTLFQQKKINFQDNNELRNVRLWGVQSYYYYDYNKSIPTINYFSGQIKTDPNYNLPIVRKKFFQQTFLNLYDINNDNFLKDAPLPIFQTIENSQEEFDDVDVFREETIVEKDHKIFTGQLFDLQNSSLSMIFPDEKYPNPSTFVIPLTFQYSRIDLDANKNLLKK